MVKLGSTAVADAAVPEIVKKGKHTCTCVHFTFQVCAETQLPRSEVLSQAGLVLDEMAHNLRGGAVRGFAFFLMKVLKQLYQRIYVNVEGVEKVSFITASPMIKKVCVWGGGMLNYHINMESVEKVSFITASPMIKTMCVWRGGGILNYHSNMESVEKVCFITASAVIKIKW